MQPVGCQLVSPELKFEAWKQYGQNLEYYQLSDWGRAFYVKE